METPNHLLKYAVELTECVLDGSGEKSMTIINNADAVANFIQTVYDKLKAISDSMD